MQARVVSRSGLLRRSVGLAAILWLSLATAAAAGDPVAADLNGDGRTDHVRILDARGRRGLVLHITGGSKIWLKTPWRVSRIAAHDVDRDGDLDLLATTERAELVAWINHGRGRFAIARPPARDDSLLSAGPSVSHTFPELRIDPGLTSDATITPTRSMPTPGIERSASRYLEPEPLARQSASVCPRGPPQA